MGINFGATTPSAPTAPIGASHDTPVVTGPAAEVSTPQGITLDLGKGAVLDLTKKEPSMTHVTLAAGWDVSQSGPQCDLDISAFMLNASGKITTADDIIYFKHMQAPGIKLNGDNLTGEGEGDDETIDIDLSMIPAQYDAIVFVVNIYEAMARRQTFGMINNSYVRLLNKDAGNKEVCRFVLKDEYASSTGVVFAKLKRETGSWKFETVGEGKVVKDLNDIVALYM